MGIETNEKLGLGLSREAERNRPNAQKHTTTQSWRFGQAKKD
jgi:hypothetical protein